MNRIQAGTSTLPKLLLIAFIGLLTWYTYVIFYTGPYIHFDLFDALLYFIPPVVLALFLWLGWKHERFEGVSMLFLSFIFLWIYHVYVGITVFAFLFILGILFLIDEK